MVDKLRRTEAVQATANRGAQLSLINNGNTVLQINYGFSIDSTGSRPLPYSYKIYE
jgi:hypothetical protein